MYHCGKTKARWLCGWHWALSSALLSTEITITPTKTQIQQREKRETEMTKLLQIHGANSNLLWRILYTEKTHMVILTLCCGLRFNSHLDQRGETHQSNLIVITHTHPTLTLEVMLWNECCGFDSSAHSFSLNLRGICRFTFKGNVQEEESGDFSPVCQLGSV